MAHEIESQNALFVGQGAWHGLGTVIPAGKKVTTQEALRIAGMDWEVTLEPIFLEDRSMVPGHKATVRNTDHKALGVVGDRFQPLQNVDAFKWFNPLLADGSAAIESCGVLRGGSRIWILVKCNIGIVEVAPGDAICPYLLLAHGHDGSLAVDIRFTTIRVVCANTLGAAVSQARGSKGIYLKHTKSLPEGLRAAQRTLDFARQTWAVSAEAFRAMAKSPMSGAEFVTFCKELFAIPVDTEEADMATRTKNQIERLEHKFGMGTGLTHHTRGTKWAAYNAITEWLDYNRSRSQETALESTWYGPSAAMRGKAMELLTVAK